MKDRHIHLTEERAKRLAWLMVKDIMSKASRGESEFEELMETEDFDRLSALAGSDPEILRTGWKNLQGV